MHDLSNEKAFAGAVMLTAIGVVAGGAIGAHGSFVTGGILAVISALVFTWFLVRGPGAVDVRFVDSGFGFWGRIRIRRTINNFYIYLRRLGIIMPPVSPLIGIRPPLGTGMIPISLRPDAMCELSIDFGTSAICSPSGTEDTCGFDSRRPRRVSIASAYIGCHLFRSLTAGGKQKINILNGSAKRIAQLYFCFAFANDTFVLRNENSSCDRWVDALLDIRYTCGEYFADTFMAYALQLLTTSKFPEGNLEPSFDDWFSETIYSAMLNTASHSGREQLNRALTMLADHNVISREKVYGKPG